jgi:hypothetical protein
MSFLLRTPGHNLVFDTYIMYGIVDRLLDHYDWVDGEVSLVGESYVIDVRDRRPSTPLPNDIRSYGAVHACGGRGRGSTARLEISPVSGKFERIGPEWSPKQYISCETCHNLAENAQKKGYAGVRKVEKGLQEYWVLSPVKIRIPLALSIREEVLAQVAIKELPRAALPHTSALLAFLSILPSPLPGRSWLFSIYALKGRLIRASIGIRADNFHEFVWHIRRNYIRFPRMMRELVECTGEGNVTPLVRLVDVALNPSLPLAYAAIREVRSALEKKGYDFDEFDRFGNALIDWCKT